MSHAPHLDGSPPWSRRLSLFCVAVLLVTASWTALAGSGNRLPLDGHDVLVARTTEEMIERRQWLVPYISEEPRLKKPPMNYWLTRGVDALTGGGGDGVVTPFEARLPSIAAGVALVLLTFALGRTLVDLHVGLIGAVMLAASSGFLSYTHSARPEMTYALFTMLGLFGFVLSDRWLEDPDRGRWARWCAWGGWAAWGLAMLTKGPQLPAITLAGELAYLWSTHGRARALRVLRPVTGVLVFCLVSLWWYAAVLVNVDNAFDVWSSEVGKRGRGRDRGWWWIVDPYFLYRTIALAIPWVAFYALALAAPWVLRLCAVNPQPLEPGSSPERGGVPRAAWRTWCWVVVGMALLCLAPRRRWYYFLPLLPALCLLMALVGLTLGRWLRERGGDRLWALLVALHVVGVGALLPVMWFTEPPLTRPMASVAWGVAGVALVVAAVMFVLLRSGRAERSEREAGVMGSLGALGLVSALALGLAAQAGSLWGATRLERAAFASQVAVLVPRDERLVSWRQDSSIEVYHAKRAIPELDDAADLAAVLSERDRVWVLISSHYKPPTVPRGWAVTTALKADFSDEAGDNDRVELCRFDRLPPGGAWSEAEKVSNPSEKSP